MFLLGRALKILAHWSRQKFGGMTRLRAATPKVFAHRGGQAEQAAWQANNEGREERRVKGQEPRTANLQSFDAVIFQPNPNCLFRFVSFVGFCELIPSKGSKQKVARKTKI
jgi:hypothetical protein